MIGHNGEPSVNALVTRRILYALYTISGLLVLADFLVHRHISTAVEKIPAFYAIYGFVACVVLVLIATQMRKLVMRDEAYYDQQRKTPETQPHHRSDDS